MKSFTEKIIIISFLLINIFSSASQAEELFSRTRHKAGLLTLISYNSTPNRMTNYNCKKAQVAGMCRMFVQEGGYNPERLYAILNIADPEVEYVAMIINELDSGRNSLPRIGSLVLSSAVSFAYAIPSADGMRAAVHAGRLGGVDKDCDSICRAVYSIIVYAIEGKLTDKNELLKVAALNAESEKVAFAIRSIRLSEWRKLPDESTLLGRLIRALFLWYRSNDFAEAISQGNRKLLYSESRTFLAVLAACWTDLPYLPENFVWNALMDREIREICAELYNMASEGILAGVPENMVYGKISESADSSREKILVNGKPVTAAENGDNNYVQAYVANPAKPSLPGEMRPVMIQTLHTAAVPQPAVTEYPVPVEQLVAGENSPLTPIKPLPALSGNSCSASDECTQEVSTVNPEDLFWGSFFAE